MGLFSDDSEFDKSKLEEEQQLAALKTIMSDTPEPLKLQEYKPEQYQYAGDIDPRLASAQSVKYGDLGDSAMQGVSTDPRLRDAQMHALSSLQEIGDGGLTAQDKADLSKIQTEANQQDRGRREAILMNNQARGMGGSGQELLAQLSSSQAATDRQAQQGLDVEGMAQQRALAALAQSGQLGGQIRGQEFNEGSAKASAADAVAKFNAANSWQNQQFNANQALQAGQFNAGQANNMAQGNRNARQEVTSGNTRSNNEAQKLNQFDAPIARQKSLNDTYGYQVEGAKAGLNAATGQLQRDAASGAASTGAILSGAGAGAATGATVGGPWGALAGGVIGAGGAYLATKKK
jgi:hypothetical protein